MLSSPGETDRNRNRLGCKAYIIFLQYRYTLPTNDLEMTQQIQIIGSDVLLMFSYIDDLRFSCRTAPIK
jgi:hypothetical protein